MEKEPSSEDIQNKENISKVFDLNPILREIGTEDQYGEYIKTIFPISPYQKIVFHGTDEKFESFDETMLGKNTSLELSEHYGKRIHFSTTPDTGYGEYLIAAVINPSEELGEYPSRDYITNPRVERVDQIHVLGTKTDTEGFKRFVEQKFQ